MDGRGLFRKRILVIGILFIILAFLFIFIALKFIKQNYNADVKLSVPSEKNVNGDVITKDPLNINGYIIQFNEMPIIQKQVEEQNEINSVTDITTKLARIDSLSNTLNMQRTKIKQERESAIKDIKTKLEKTDLNIKGQFEDVFNGVVLDITSDESNKLKGLPEIKNIYPNLLVKADLMDSIPLIGADRVWSLDKNGNNCNQSGKDCLTGKNVTIAIIDTGVDYTQPDLGGCFGGVVGPGPDNYYCVKDGVCKNVEFNVSLGNTSTINFNGASYEVSPIYIGCDPTPGYPCDSDSRWVARISLNGAISGPYLRLKQTFKFMGKFTGYSEVPVFINSIYYSTKANESSYVDLIIGENGGLCPSDCSPEMAINRNCKVLGGYNFVNMYDTRNPIDDNGHGTHVAATAAGKGVLNGVAPDAKIFAYKVLDKSGTGYTSDIISAIGRSVDPNQDGNITDHVDIISMSLGSICIGNYSKDCGPDDPTSQAVDNAVNAGVVVVVSAGNFGPNPGTIESPGTARKAITVGASNKTDKMATSSSVGPVQLSNETIMKPDLVAPGVNICAAGRFFYIYGVDISSQIKCIDDLHILLSGTSMAAPHVAGVAALIKQANSSWSPSQIKQYIMNNTKKLFDQSGILYNQTIQGNGRVDLSNFLVPQFLISIADNGPSSMWASRNGTNYLCALIPAKGVCNLGTAKVGDKVTVQASSLPSSGGIAYWIKKPNNSCNIYSNFPCSFIMPAANVMFNITVTPQATPTPTVSQTPTGTPTKTPAQL